MLRRVAFQVPMLGVAGGTLYFLTQSDLSMDSQEHSQGPPPLWKPHSRSEQLSRLKADSFDLLIIGGGATGAGCAVDASSRGLKVALVEQEDFGAGNRNSNATFYWFDLFGLIYRIMLI